MIIYSYTRFNEKIFEPDWIHRSYTDNAFPYKKFSNYLNCFAANCVVNDYSFNKLLLVYSFNFENE